MVVLVSTDDDARPAAIRPPALLSAVDFCAVLFSAVTTTAPAITILAALPMKASTMSLFFTSVLVLVTPIRAPTAPVPLACASQPLPGR